MATLVFTAVGTALGGPLGGLVGGLVGRQVDAAIFGGGGRKGPRLDDLRVTTSSYGSTIPRHHGVVRAPGTIIWSTDLVEHSNTQGGGKSGPSVTTYSYSVSLAVALSSRPIQSVGRIWADGNLLRGEAGDLKASGAFRLYTGQGDQPVDPLIASALGEQAPAFRGTAYAVFEDLDLSNFGNRIPALSFEIFADTDATSLAPMLYGIVDPAQVTLVMAGLGGFSDDGGPATQMLATIDAVYPLGCDCAGDALRIFPAEDVPTQPLMLPEPTISADDTSFGANEGRNRQRIGDRSDLPSALRYYDRDRDYLAGMQRVEGRSRPGRELTIEFPGTLSSVNARALANAAADRAGWAKETMLWRVAELDPALGPGGVVRAPGHTGLWRIVSWEWRSEGIELQLLRLPPVLGGQPIADGGAIAAPTDLVAGPTVMAAFELPADDSSSTSAPSIRAAVSSATAGWAGAALYADAGGQLVALGGSGKRRSLIGTLSQPLGASDAAMLERQATLTVALASPDFALASTDAQTLAAGANRALVGGEIIQFATATPLGGGAWRLAGLLRGRGGTESAAKAGHNVGTRFVLLDDTLRVLDPQTIGQDTDTIVATGLGDATPITATIANRGLTLRPLTPVHPRVAPALDGGLDVSWTRRARGAWPWRDGVDTPLVEEREAYLVGAGPVDAPYSQWETIAPALTLTAGQIATITDTHPGAPLWVRQIGSFGLSDPLLLTTLP